jgi:pilus assembly protein CpaB
MNSTLLRILAICLALGAIITAGIGYRLSTKQVAPIAPPPPPTYPQVIAARDIPAGVLLTAQDVRLESLTQREPQSYDSVSKVVGKLTLEPISASMPVLTSHFPRLGQVAQSLKPGERGVAIKVTEVIGVGGFVTPGDHVDVLLYVRGNKETGDVSSAQVVLRDVRVLAYGEETGETDEQPGTLQKMAGEAPGAANTEKPKKENEKGKSSSSAVLAVPEREASRLMLADRSGELRLALRGAEPPEMAPKPEDAARYLRLAELASPAGQALPKAVPVAKPLPVIKSAVRKATSTQKTKAAPAATSSVIVHRGDQVEVVTVRK